MAWLLCFALLLPVAQLASAAHVLSHLHDIGVSGGGDPDTGHVQHCPICPLAAAIGADGLPSAPAGLQFAVAPATDTNRMVPPSPPVVALRRPANRGPPRLLA